MSEGFPSLTHERRAFPLPTISEDTLQYAVHLPPAPAGEGAADVAADATALATLISSEVAAALPAPWLWNKDAWELKVVPSHTARSAGAQAAQAGSKLEGRMRVGDAVDDEWLVVWLLRGVSARHPELALGVRDNDGEFLLIEAAHALPAWVAPENAANRLWLMAGHWHLLPLSVRSANPPRQTADDAYDDDGGGRALDPEAWLSEDDALAALRADPDKYRVPPAVAAAIDARISR